MANANFTCVLDAWRDGKTLYGRMHYYRSGSYYYQDSSFPNPTMNLGGSTFTDTEFGNRVRSGIYVGDVYTTTFSRTVSGTGDRTVTFTAGSGQRSDFAGSWSKTVNFPVEYTAPTGLSVSLLETYADGAKLKVSVSSYGNPSSADGRWVEAGIAGQNAWKSPSLRSDRVLNVKSAEIVVNNSSTRTTTLTIRPNTQYYYGGYANNTQLNANKIPGQFVTLALAPTLSAGTINDDSVVLNYSLQADDGFYAKNVQYSLDNGTTWKTGATVNSNSATTGSFTVTGLTQDTAYTVMTRVSTTAGTNAGNNVSFTTLRSSKFYGSVNGSTKLIEKFYGEVNGRTKEVVKLYGPEPHASVTIGTLTGEIDQQQPGALLAIDTDAMADAIRADQHLGEEMYGHATFEDLVGLQFISALSGGEFVWAASLLFYTDSLYTIPWHDNGDSTLAEIGITADETMGYSVGFASLTATSGPGDIYTYTTKLIFQQ